MIYLNSQGDKLDREREKVEGIEEKSKRRLVELKKRMKETKRKKEKRGGGNYSEGVEFWEKSKDERFFIIEGCE